MPALDLHTIRPQAGTQAFFRHRQVGDVRTSPLCPGKGGNIDEFVKAEMRINPVASIE